MWRDSSVPRGQEAETREVVRTMADGARLRWLGSIWTPEGLASLTETLARGARWLSDVPEDRLLAAWVGAVDELRRPETHPWAARLREDLSSLCRLSPEGLSSGLDAVLEGVSEDPARRLFEQAGEIRSEDGSPVWVVLSSNLPGLAVQSLLPALASRRPILLKSASSEPLFAPAFVDALCRREPMLRTAIAATTWAGGRTDLESAVLERVGQVVAYGGGDAMADLDRRAKGKLVAHGPKISLAVVSSEGSGLGLSGIEAISAGLARDIALFDQRGCLSIQAIYSDARTPYLREKLARGIAEELASLAIRWPLGPSDSAEEAHVRMVQDEAIMRALTVVGATAVDGTAAGGVLIDPDPHLRPAPGRRWVRLHTIEDLGQLPAILEEWAGRLQGVALAGDGAWALEEEMKNLGVSHLAEPGALQSPDMATWANGGVAPLEPFLGPRAGG